MKRYIKSDSDYISFKPPIRKSDIDIDYVAKRISRNLSEKPDVEDGIEQFRMMSDDYDDFWGRGLRTREQEQAFVEELLDALRRYGITEITNIYNI